MATNTQPTDLILTTYGDTADIVSLSRRIKVMVPGGNKLGDNEAQALAQLSLITQCNPFIGEIWYIPGHGPMIGIKGARRHSNKQVQEAGGKDAYWTPSFRACSPEEAGAKDIKDVAAAWKCTINDSVSTLRFQKMFLETVNTLRAAGCADPVKEAHEIVGYRPEWVGYGFSTMGENTRMNKQAVAMKRAEADALKKRFDIPFGAEVAAGDTAMEAEASDWVEASVATPAQVDAAFPPDTETVNQETGKPEQPIEIVSVMSEWAVKEAAKFWNIPTEEAAKAISKKWHGNMDKREFLDLLHSPDA